MTATEDQIAALVAAPELPSVAVLRLRPGGTLVVRVKRMLADGEFEHVTGHLREQFPDNKVAILEGDTEVLVLRKDGE